MHLVSYENLDCALTTYNDSLPLRIARVVDTKSHDAKSSQDLSTRRTIRWTIRWLVRLIFQYFHTETRQQLSELPGVGQVRRLHIQRQEHFATFQLFLFTSSSVVSSEKSSSEPDIAMRDIGVFVQSPICSGLSPSKSVVKGPLIRLPSGCRS